MFYRSGLEKDYEDYTNEELVEEFLNEALQLYKKDEEEYNTADTRIYIMQNEILQRLNPSNEEFIEEFLNEALYLCEKENEEEYNDASVQIKNMKEEILEKLNS